MSAVVDPKSSVPSPPVVEEPIYYGYRFVHRTLPDGQEVVERVDLTREDVLHPQDGDAIMQNEPHDEDRMYLKAVFKRAIADDPMALVVADLGVDLDIPGQAHFCPDITVFFGVPEKRLWTMYYVAEVGVRPWLIIEITSPSTRADDLSKKVGFYHRGGVPLYLIADAIIKDEERTVRLIGYRHTPTGYAEWLPDERGWFWLDRLGVWLGTAQGRVVCYDVQGQEIGDYVHVSQAWAAAEMRAAEEAQARAAAETRAGQEAQARAAAETRAAEEAQARAAAEQRLRELEERLRRLEAGGQEDQP
jgi:hypothetical protein